MMTAISTRELIQSGERKTMKITITGSGNIGSALVTGLLRSGAVAPADIVLTDVNENALSAFASQGVNVTRDNREAAKSASLVVLCVKPYLVHAVIKEILPSLADDALLVSFAAGITLDQLTLSAGKRPLFRVIPNTAMAVNRSMTCVASANADAGQQQTVLDFFGLVGKAISIDESLMNAATVIASCGTAFALRYLRAAVAAGVETGFRPDVAQAMIAQTMAGAAALIAESGNHPEQEIDRVTTPKGITIKGLNEMEHAGFSSAVMKGILAAYRVFE
ncbi:MAG: pyrroline-5-carboxylate reductase [Bacteroidales bacterium]|jgi:pyrroline-5-carboxylate reductase|nr:pyrroline-5-carboxylate reductase [Bacteroidales bacterium]